MAWKILRGAELASTKMATVGGVAAELESEMERVKKERQTTPKILESFIFEAPWVRRIEFHIVQQNLRL